MMEAPRPRLVQLDRNPSARTLRSFGGALAIVCAGRVIWSWSQSGWPVVPSVQLGFLSACALSLALCAWQAPQLLRGVYVLLGVLTYPIRWVVALTILATLYFAVITPIAWTVRLYRHVFAPSARPHQDTTAWCEARPRMHKRDYFRQF